MNRVRHITLSELLMLAVAFFIGMYLIIFNMSACYVAWNPELAHLRVPFLVLTILVVTVSVVASVLALILVFRNTNRNIIDTRTVANLPWQCQFQLIN